MRRGNRPLSRAHLASFSLFAFALLLYSGTLANGFAYDDVGVIVNNEMLRQLGAAFQLFTLDYWEPYSRMGNYRPLVSLSFLVNYALAGQEPWSYHAINVLLHALNCLLLLALLRRVVSGPVAVLASFLFAAHAIHTEPVANLALGRPELLGTFWSLLTLICLASSAPGTNAGGATRAIGVACFGLALLSKETFIALPAVLFLYHVAVAGPRLDGFGASVRRALAQNRGVYLALLGIAMSYGLLRVLALRDSGILPPRDVLQNPLVVMDVTARTLNALHVASLYVWKMVLPLRLAYDYSYDQLLLLRVEPGPRVLGTLGVSTLYAFLLVLSYRSSRALFFALGLSAVTFLVVSNIVVPIGTIMGDRLVYFPSIGFCLAVAIGLDAGVRRLASTPRARTQMLALAGAAVVAAHAARAIDRIPDWKSSETLYLADVQVSPRSVRAQYNAGWARAQRDQHEEALRHFRAALDLWPDYVKAYKGAGLSLSSLGRSKAARRMYEEAVARGSEDPIVFNNLGFALVDSGIDVDRGVELLTNAVALAPDNAEVLDSLGWGYYKQGRANEALPLLQRSLELDPDGPTAGSRRAHLAAVQRALEQAR